MLSGLEGRAIPALPLEAAVGPPVDLAELAAGLAVVFVYPGTGVPGEPLPPGWLETPGAYGCTAETCAVRDRAAGFAALGAAVAGLSAQPLAAQREYAARERIGYPLLNDSAFRLADDGALGLPTFTLAGRRYYRRVTLVARGGRVARAFTSIPDPGAHPAEVLEWLSSDGSLRTGPAPGPG